MLRIVSHRFVTAAFALALMGLVGCMNPAGPQLPKPVALPEIEIRTQHSSNPLPEYDATCQITASVALLAAGSHDPAGQSLVYEWSDSVDGVRTPDFYPASNPMRTSEPIFDTGLFTLGVHDITLTVIAQDGRKARKTLRVLVTSCEECGKPIQ